MYWPAVMVAAAALVMGAPTLKGTFVGGDDHRLVLDHVLVNHPSPAHAAKLFTILHRDLYQPLPLLSFSAEFAVAIPLGLFDESVKGGAWLFHLSNVLLHAVNALLVFQLIRRFESRDGGGSGLHDRAPFRDVLDSESSRRLTLDAARQGRNRRGITPSVAGAAAVAGVLFAVHPLNVEVVAWLNGRMMLLSTLFALASLIAFDRWMAGGLRGRGDSRDSSAPTGGGRYTSGTKDRGTDGDRTAATGGGRYTSGTKDRGTVGDRTAATGGGRYMKGDGEEYQQAVAGEGRRWAWLTMLFVACSALSKIRVELPLLMFIVPILRRQRIGIRFLAPWGVCVAITAALAAVNYVATARAGLFAGAGENLHGPTPVRALLGLAWYFEHLVWPAGLASWYPTPATVAWSDPETLRAAVVLLVVAMAVWSARRLPAALPGFGWFLVSIAATLQLVPSRNVLAADRYMYLPMIGLLWVLAAGSAACFRLAARRWAAGARIVAGPVFVAVVVALVATSWHVAWFYETPVRKSERIASLTPTTPRVWERLAWAYHREGRHDDAIECARKELAHNDGMVRSEALQVIGSAAMALGRPDEALTNLRQAIVEDPESPEATYHFAVVLEELGRFDEAMSFYEQTVARAPLANPWIHRLAGLYRRVGRADDARAMLLRVLDNNLYDPRATMGLAELDIGRGGPEEFRAAERRLLTLLDWMPEYADAWVNVGVARHGLGRTEQAIEAYRRALQADPSHPVAALNLATIYVTDGDAGSAAPLFERAAAGGLPTVEQTVEVHDFFVTHGEPNRAVRLWADFLERVPNSNEARAFWCWSLALNGDAEKASAAAEALLRKEPGEPLALAAQVRLALGNGRYEQANEIAGLLAETNARGADARRRLLRALGEVVLRQPDLPWTYCVAARLWMADERWEEARAFIDKCDEQCTSDSCRATVSALRAMLPVGAVSPS